MEEFTDSIGWKIFYGVIAVCIVGFALFLFTGVHSNADSGAKAFITIILAFPLVLIIAKIIRKVTVSADSIISTGLLGRKELLTANIKGFRIGDKIIRIEPLSSTYATIVINSYSDLDDSRDLIKWLRDNFTDLDAEDVGQELDKISHDTSLGVTQQDREEKLTKQKRAALVYNVAGAVLGFAGFFLNGNYWITIILLTYPLVGIVIMKSSFGLIKFVSSKKRSIYPNILLGFYLPVLAIFISAIMEYNIFSYQNFWLVAIIITLIVAAFLYRIGVNNASGTIVGQVVMMVVLSGLYGYGSTTQLNCLFDKSKPQTFTASVLDHRITRGKSTSYYLTLGTWGPSKHPMEVTVHKELYHEMEIGQTVKVNYKTGLLHIPWFTVTD